MIEKSILSEKFNDPTEDIEGFDALYKMSILSKLV